jgi:hypothetical protein
MRREMPLGFEVADELLDQRLVVGHGRFTLAQGFDHAVQGSTCLLLHHPALARSYRETTSTGRSPCLPISKLRTAASNQSSALPASSASAMIDARTSGSWPT